MQYVIHYFLLFILYAFLGWIGESTYVSLAEHHKAKKENPKHKFKFINRGFLSGPIVPIYGAGGLAMTLFLSPFKGNYIVIFLVGVLVCDTIEFVTSYVMEKLFNARWWDYTGKFGNIQGRIDFKHSLYWGVGSVLYITFVYPPVEKFLNLFDDRTKTIVFWVTFTFFLIDFVKTVLTTIGIVRIRRQLERLAVTARDTSPEELLTLTAEKIQELELYKDTKDSIETFQFKTKWVMRRAQHIFKSYPKILETIQGHADAVLQNPTPDEVVKQFSFLTMFLQAFARDDKPEML